MTKTLKRVSISIGTLILLIPIAASVYTAIVSRDHRMFIPAVILVVLTAWVERRDR